MAPRIVITGGAGFIGCTLAQHLVGEGRDLLALDVMHPQVHKEPGRPGRLPASVPLWPFDVTDAAAWDAFFHLERPSVIVHLAAETGTGQSLREASRHGSVNVVGTTQMLDGLSRSGHVPDHLVLASSRAVYGEGAWEAGGERFYPGVRTHDELAMGRWDPSGPSGEAGRSLPSAANLTVAGPTNIYAATKLAQEHVLSAWGAAMACPVTVLRLQNVYGAGQSLDNPYTGVLSIFARQALSNQTIEVYEDGNIIRDFVHVGDVATALVAAIDRPPAVAQTIDIGSGSSTTILEVAVALARLAGAPEPRVTGAFRDGDVRAASCVIDEARTALGYTPAWSLADGLESLLESARSELGEQ